MTRGLRHTAIALATLLAAGCGGQPASTTTKPPTRTSELGEPKKANNEGPLLANWPKEGLEGALVISGEMIGFLEPCGCTAGQRGGLARRLDLVQRLQKQGWNVALIDLGSMINDPNKAGGPLETRIRYTYALKALDLLGYDALALSPTDLRLGIGEVMTQYMNNLGEKLKVVSANIKPDAGLGLEQKVVPSLRTQVGGVKVGITAVIEPAEFAKLSDPDRDLLAAKDPEAVLPDVLAELEHDTHMQVLMVQGTPAYARALAEKFPGFEVVVATSEVVDPMTDTEELNGGRTHLLSVGKKGQYVGVMGLYKDPKQKFRYSRVDLNQRYNSKTEAMRKLVDEDFQQALEQADVLGSYPRRAFVFASNAPTDATFVGGESCKTCHPKTYEHWSKTGHARAYEALTSNPQRNREFDAQCISCHTVGFEYNGGFTSKAATPHLMNVQCENCHGPASKHVAAPDDAVARVSMHRDKGDFDKNQRCIDCHSEDDSPHFDFLTYWPKVEHNDLDVYTDPKVHQGLAPAKPAAPPATK